MKKDNIYCCIYMMLGIFFFIPMISIAQTHNQNNQKVDEYYYRAINEQGIGHIDEAWNLMKYCELLDSLNAPVNFQMGVLTYTLSGSTQSLKYYQRAYNEDKDNEMYVTTYANNLADIGRVSEAISILKSYVTSHPENDDLMQMLAMFYLKDGKVDDAIKIYNKLLALNKKNPVDYERYSLAKVQIYQAIGQQDKMIEQLKKLVDKYPEKLNYKYDLIQSMSQSPKYKKEALRYINELCTKPQTKSIGLFFKANYLISNKDFVRVDSTISELLQINGDIAPKLTLINRYYLLSLSDTTKVKNVILPYYKTLLLTDSDNVSILVSYAFALNSIGLHSDALKEANAAIKITPKNAELYDKLVKIFLNEKTSNECKIVCDLAIKNKVVEPEYYLYSALPLIDEKKNKEAISILEEGLKQKSFTQIDLSKLQGLIGDIYDQMNDKKQAINAYEKAMKLDPNNAMVANNYAYLLVELKDGDLVKAERLAAIAVKMDPNNSNNLDTYAWIFYKKHKYTLARLYISNAIDKAQGQKADATLYEHAAIIYQAIGDNNKAISYYQAAIVQYRKNEKANKDKIMKLLQMVKKLTTSGK